MHNFTGVELELLEAMLRIQGNTFKTYRYARQKAKYDKNSKRQQLWKCAQSLEKLKLIQRISHEKTKNILHKVCFDKELLKEKYHFSFVEDWEDNLITKEKETLSIRDMEEIIKGL
jgi:hypothetical protein